MALAPRRALLSVPSSSIRAVSIEPLAERVAAAQLVGDLAVDVADGLLDALAAVALAAVAQLDGLVLAGGRAARHRRPAARAAGQHDLDLDGRVAARVEDLAAVDVDDLAHGWRTVVQLSFGTGPIRPMPTRRFSPGAVTRSSSPRNSSPVGASRRSCSSGAAARTSGM